MALQNGAGVNAVEDDKWTALHWAAQDGHTDVAKMLLQNGADVNAVMKGNWTAAHRSSNGRTLRG